MSGRGNRHKTAGQLLGPALPWEKTQRRSVDESSLVIRILKDLEHVWVVVAQWDGGDLGVDVEQHIAIDINNVVAYALVVVCEVDDCIGELECVQLCNQLLGFRSWNGCFDTWSRGLSQDEARKAFGILWKLPEKTSFRDERLKPA